MLADAVDGGDSVSFMDGFGADDARAFYESLLPELERGTRVLLAAYVDGELVGTFSSSTPGRRTRSTVPMWRSCSCTGARVDTEWGGR